jgi:hypothetical protein
MAQDDADLKTQAGVHTRGTALQHACAAQRGRGTLLLDTAAFSRFDKIQVYVAERWAWHESRCMDPPNIALCILRIFGAVQQYQQ